ncbi:hypothetical protein PRZ48_006881 [Zasmidium cellare]|uniref:Uncharacterized protein n=1 Tax=Zasmidium cellare TaxID=395010 RepID=A0ABR0EIT3_ZASCE|nr:hypothetical protein PRZ48_006881 [Zasmidium cellare]
MASPRPPCSRRLSSAFGPDTDGNDAGYAQENRENITDLITRLQDPYGDTIRIHIMDDKNERPILLQRTLIERVSPWLEKWVQQNMQQFGSRDLYMDTGDEMTRKMFLFCIMKRRVPSMRELQLGDGKEARCAYQSGLVRIWTYAAETEVAEVQDAVMRVLWDLRETLCSHVMRDGLKGTQHGSKMRRALVEMVVGTSGKVPEALLRDLGVRNVFGWEEDFEDELKRWKERGCVRATLEEFLVEKQEPTESDEDKQSSDEMVLD